MSQTITIRLTPQRERMLNRLKRRFKVKRNSDAIDLALKMSVEEEIDYKTRIERVAGCIRLPGKKDSTKRIRDLREDR